MIDIKVAKRYAKSLIDLANEQGVLDAVQNDMQFFSKVSSMNQELGLMLTSPLINGDKKLAVLKKIFSQEINTLTMSFFVIVVKKGREKYLIQISKEFISQYKTLKKILTAEIISAVGLDDKLRKQVYSILKNDSNSEVELVEKTNPKLIGGFILRIGDLQFDSSVASSLRKLTQAFAENPYLKRN